MKVNLTKLEAQALIMTAGNMKDDLEYFDYMPKKQYEAFKAAYFTGIDKLREITKERKLKEK